MSRRSFLREFFKANRMVGSVLPSSRFLSSKMLAPIDFSKSKVVVELGPGTGVFTKALLKAMPQDSQLLVIELNEAFAAQALACIRSWGLADNDPRINPNGGAIALGHPLGMSGARILGSAALELQEQHKRFALVTMCIGVGQGFAVVLERA